MAGICNIFVENSLSALTAEGGFLVKTVAEILGVCVMNTGQEVKKRASCRVFGSELINQLSNKE
jgi:hypothetical protein